MFFWGIKTRKLREGELTNLKCEYCGETETYMEYTFSQKYFHLYWIPLFPLRKKTEVYCDDCCVTYENNKIPKEAAKKLNYIKDRHPIRTPVWMFSGTIILAVFFSWAFYQSDKHDAVEAGYIDNPKKGDVYFVDSGPEYSTFRIDKVDNESVYYTSNDTSVSKYTKVFFINNDKYYTDKKGSVSRKKLKDLYKKDSIMSISRD